MTTGPGELVLSNARVVLRDEVLLASVVVRDGVIADIAAGGARGDDLEGDFLLPGLVELHTDHLESHVVPRPGTGWDPIPAVLSHDVQLSGAGATTVFDAIRLGFFPGDPAGAASGPTVVAAIEHAARAQITRAEHFIHLRCEVAAPTAARQFEAFQDNATVRLVSLMDHTPGQRQYADPEAFRRYMVGKGRIAADELEATVTRLRADAERCSEPNRRVIARLARQRGITLAAHDDATAEHVRESAALGVAISEFPTTEVAARAARAGGQLVVMGAPNIVRGASQSGNVAAGDLLALGVLDILSSDYVPASPLQAIFQLAADGVLPIHRGAELVATTPARAVGLHDRGEIAVGRRADLVRVHAHRLAATESHPRGRCVPVVRSLHRGGARVL